jgi:hypothetical protein
VKREHVVGFVDHDQPFVFPTRQGAQDAEVGQPLLPIGLTPGLVGEPREHRRHAQPVGERARELRLAGAGRAVEQQADALARRERACDHARRQLRLARDVREVRPAERRGRRGRQHPLGQQRGVVKRGRAIRRRNGPALYSPLPSSVTSPVAISGPPGWSRRSTATGASDAAV